MTQYWKRSQTYWPAHIGKPDGKVNNLALGSDDAFQILGSVIRNQLHKFSNRGEKWLHIKNRVEYHHISHQAGKGRDKREWWTHIHSVTFYKPKTSVLIRVYTVLGFAKNSAFPISIYEIACNRKLVSFIPIVSRKLRLLASGRKGKTGIKWCIGIRRGFKQSLFFCSVRTFCIINNTKYSRTFFFVVHIPMLDFYVSDPCHFTPYY